jgi:hypothetical protein
MTPITQLEIDQQVFTLYNEYCHGGIDRRAFAAKRLAGCTSFHHDQYLFVHAGANGVMRRSSPSRNPGPTVSARLHTNPHDLGQRNLLIPEERKNRGGDFVAKIGT